MDTAKDPTKSVCRVCDEAGHYDLGEMKFRCNDTDVLLIDAYNSFSVLNNDSSEIYLCELCTESLTLAYSFWEQIKRSDEKFMKLSRQKSIKNEGIKVGTTITVTNFDLTEDEPQTHENSDKSIELDEKIDEEPHQKRIRKRKSNPEPEVYEMKIGTNIALPHFVIGNLQVDDDEASMENDPLDDLQSSSASHGKIIKTLKPSAVIPSDLDKINELLGLSPLDSDGDSHSIYKCSHCPKAFAAPHHLMIHMRKSHLCQYCLATFPKINDLYTHVKEMHKTFECLLCGKEFQSNGNLRQHMRKNHSIFLPAHTSLLNISQESLK